MIKHLLSILAIAVLIQACDRQRVFEDFTDLEQGFWHQDSVLHFRFSITDVDQTYRLMTLFRNKQAYPYHNMYYRYTLRDAKDSILQQELKQIFLFDPKTGKPNGGGIGSTFDHSQVVSEKFTFPTIGDYSVDIQQYMRLDTLPHIRSVGWRVERVSE
jgi:gliding motility-associated lipoprotein GldH